MSTATAIVLFNDDFRLNDNPSLHYACKKYDSVVPLYIYQEDYLGRKLGGASKVFLHYVLKAFDELLKEKYGINLVIRCGDVLQNLNQIIEETNASAIYFNRSYTEKQIQTEKLIVTEFSHVDVQSFKGKILFDPNEIQTSNGEPFKIFTPFSKECLKNIEKIDEIFPIPEKIENHFLVNSLSISDLNLLPKNEGSWYENLIKNWEFNYDRIYENFNNFIEKKLIFYSDTRNNPAEYGNANISPYLRFGMMSAKICFEASAIKFTNYHNQFNLELLWREFAYHTMYYNQNIVTQELRLQYQGYEWENDEELLNQWQRGVTGFEIVDAGMRELWKTGAMHNRVRMITASFLIKDLRIDWRLGEKWFWECLIDADPAINPFSWQWVFGSGFDGAPYFRIFNPDLQKERFDPKGIYCRKWLGDFYNIKKIVDHNTQRNITLEKYKTLMLPNKIL